MQRSKLNLTEDSKVDLTCAIDKEIVEVREDGWRENQQKQGKIKSRIYYEICEFAKDDDDDLRGQETEDVYGIAERQEEYN